MKDENYFVVQGWMINKLKLSGNELNIFAIIYGFSQDGVSCFDGSAQYLADFCGISRVSALNILAKLTEKGFIQKTEKYIGKLKLCSYKTTTGMETLPVKNLNNGSKETLLGSKETIPVGSKETLPNNKYITNNISNNISNSASPFGDDELFTVDSIPGEKKKLPLREREPENDMERVEKTYLSQWDYLLSRGLVKTRDPPPSIWTPCRALMKRLIPAFGVDNICSAVAKAAEDDFCLQGGYSLQMILAGGVITRLVNGQTKTNGKSPLHGMDGDKDQKQAFEDWTT